jgi:hypothetical protein
VPAATNNKSGRWYDIGDGRTVTAASPTCSVLHRMTTPSFAKKAGCWGCQPRRHASRALQGRARRRRRRGRASPQPPPQAQQLRRSRDSRACAAAETSREVSAPDSCPGTISESTQLPVAASTPASGHDRLEPCSALVAVLDSPVVDLGDDKQPPVRPVNASAKELLDAAAGRPAIARRRVGRSRPPRRPGFTPGRPPWSRRRRLRVPRPSLCRAAWERLMRASREIC